MMTVAYGARISDCGVYRYRLWRKHLIGHGESRAVFIMLNPSTADHEIDDPTIRRCMGYARAWSFNNIDVVNLFALRATDPADLANARTIGHDIVGPENDGEILSVCKDAQRVIAAWGKPRWSWVKERADRVREKLDKFGVDVDVLALTKSGDPRHPLYLPKSAVPHRWEAA